jgi:uncharacterized LabA/DUF88 family protein
MNRLVIGNASRISNIFPPEGMPDFELRPFSPPRVPIRGVSFLQETSYSMSRRMACFVDGFNLYHSVSATQQLHPNKALKWLDVAQMCHGLAHIVSNEAMLVSIDYFTALPYHLKYKDPDRVHRHQIYLRALSAQRRPSIRIHEGKISRQTIEISREGQSEHWDTWREKGTDVALAATVLELSQLDAFDDAVIISGDADYVPLVNVFTRLNPEKTVRFALPFLRESRELKQAAPLSFTLSAQTYISRQMSLSVRLPSGKHVHCPKEWLSR